jgi:16S rRNA C967 or C1407 C5-methylase (RsmB/RsmF family)
MAKNKGRAAFFSHYNAIFGERWDTLSQALLQEREHVSPAGLIQAYHLDAASLYPPSVLGPKAGEHILDLCAAPGGKSLQLAVALQGTGRLVLNEMSRARRNRLENVIKDHLEPALRAPIEIWGKDGSLLGMSCQNRFDGILLDAPCSSERHLLANDKELEVWSPNRSQQLAHRQMALLCSALELLKPGGRLVYSTCALSPLENQANVEKFLKKRSGRIEALPLNEGPGEACGTGRLILPDLCQGQGPMFTAAFIKTEH